MPLKETFSKARDAIRRWTSTSVTGEIVALQINAEAAAIVNGVVSDKPADQPRGRRQPWTERHLLSDGTPRFGVGSRPYTPPPVPPWMEHYAKLANDKGNKR